VNKSEINEEFLENKFHTDVQASGSLLHREGSLQENGHLTRISVVGVDMMACPMAYLPVSGGCMLRQMKRNPGAPSRCVVQHEGAICPA
jgi:hypothetical protein